MAPQQPKRPRPSFAVFVTGAFVLTAVLSVLVTASMVIISWNMNRGLIFTDEDLYWAILIAGVIALVISIVLGLFVGSGIATPVRKISEAAQGIRDGNLSARTGLHGDDELYRLGETFDEMADVIERDRDLERQLIGDVAHELRTPIMAVQATVEAIQDGVYEADEVRLATLSAEARRLGRLVDALLHLNRLENGVTELHIETLSISELMSDLVMTHEALAESVGLELDSSIEPNVLVEGDRDLISQALTNLISNAVRYTPEGGRIGLILERKDGNACISVLDTGIGISEEDLKRVFSRFWRADDARQSGTGGLGIGLSLVREVADQHRGEVGVESELGVGSTFYMRLPLSPLDPSVATPNRSEARRVARAAKREQERLRREQDKARKEQDKLRKLQERAQRKDAAGSTQLTLFGIKVPLSPLPFKREDAPSGGPVAPERAEENKEEGGN